MVTRFSILAILLAATAAPAQILNLRTATAVYGWQRYDDSTSASTHARAYESIAFDLGQGHWSLRGSGSVSNDFASSQSEDPFLRLYHLYVEGRGLADMVDVKAGRVPLFFGIGATTIDGAQVRVRLDDDRYAVTLAGGGQMQSSSSVNFFGKLSDNLLLGGQATARVGDRVRVGAFYVKQSHTPPPDSIGVDTTLQTVYFQPTKQVEERAGLDASAGLLDDKLEIYLRGDYDLLLQTLSRKELSVLYRPIDALTVRVEGLQRDALIPYNSIFYVFDHGNYTEVSGSATYLFDAQNSATAVLGHESYVDGSAFRVTLAADNLLREALTIQSGDVGSQVTFSLERPLALSHMLTVNAGFSFSSYKLPTATEATTAWAILGGASVRPSPTFSADAQLQVLQNAWYKNDLRLFVRANWWLFSRF